MARRRRGIDYDGHIHVPACTHLIRERINRYTESPGQPKVPNLQLSSSIDQQVLGFKVSMEYTIIMAECDTLLGSVRGDDNATAGSSDAANGVRVRLSRNSRQVTDV